MKMEDVRQERKKIPVMNEMEKIDESLTKMCQDTSNGMNHMERKKLIEGRDMLRLWVSDYSAANYRQGR